MSGLNDILGQLMQPGTLNTVSERTGVPPSAAASVVASALPLLVGALARNAQSQDGAASLASALNRDHDGSVLDNLTGFLGSGQAPSMGDAILGHVFGNRTGTVTNALGRTAGVDAGQAGQILAMLAPLVLGALGRQTRQEGIGPDQLQGRLQAERTQLESASPMGGMLTQLLDQDGDGSVMDDVADLAKRFLR
jgi:hypothetical protein